MNLNADHRKVWNTERFRKYNESVKRTNVRKSSEMLNLFEKNGVKIHRQPASRSYEYAS